jgi:hypothetical protein
VVFTYMARCMSISSSKVQALHITSILHIMRESI